MSNQAPTPKPQENATEATLKRVAMGGGSAAAVALSAALFMFQDVRESLADVKSNQDDLGVAQRDLKHEMQIQIMELRTRVDRNTVAVERGVDDRLRKSEMRAWVKLLAAQNAGNLDVPDL